MCSVLLDAFASCHIHFFLCLFARCSLLILLNLLHRRILHFSLVLQPSGIKQNTKFFFSANKLLFINPTDFRVFDVFARNKIFKVRDSLYMLRCGGFFLLFVHQKMFTLNRKLVNFFYCLIGFNVQFYRQWLIFSGFYFIVCASFWSRHLFHHIYFSLAIWLNRLNINKWSKNLLFQRDFSD